MSKENTFKILMLFILLGDLLVLVFVTLFFIEYLSYGVIASLFFVLFYTIFNLYFRIQHNIDAKFMKSRLDSKQEPGEVLDSINNLKKSIEGRFDYIKEFFSLQENLIMKVFNLQRNILDRYNIFQNEEILMRNYFWTVLKYLRLEKLQKLVPDLFNYKTLLYIGASRERAELLNEFKNKGYKIDIIEAFKPNFEYLVKNVRVNKIFHGDIRSFEFNKKYDVVLWWHGPEHVRGEEVEPTLKKVLKLTKKILVLGCPFGSLKQGKVHENPYESHLSYFDVGFFEKWGFKVEYVGEKDFIGSSIIAVKDAKDNLFKFA